MEKPDDDTRSMGSSMDCSFSNAQSVEECNLSWRNDPSYNFSDWTIRVRVYQDKSGEASLETETYHVHRNILAIGSRRSVYFGNLFHYGIDDGDHSTNVELNERAASFFPDLLDYMYGSTAFAICTRNAVALLFLSQAFQLPTLQQLVERFIERDVCLFNFGCYLSDALYYSDETMAMKVMDKCGNEVLQFCGNNQTLSRVLRAPLSSTAIKTKQKIQETWSFFTGASEALAAPAFAVVKRRSFPQRNRPRGGPEESSPTENASIN